LDYVSYNTKLKHLEKYLINHFSQNNTIWIYKKRSQAERNLKLNQAKQLVHMTITEYRNRAMGSGDIIAQRDIHSIPFKPAKKYFPRTDENEIDEVIEMKFVEEKSGNPGLVDVSGFFNLPSDAPPKQRKCDKDQASQKSRVFSRTDDEHDIRKRRLHFSHTHNKSDSDLLHFSGANTSIAPLGYKFKNPIIPSPSTVDAPLLPSTSYVASTNNKTISIKPKTDSRCCYGEYRVDWGYDNI
jgi:hypothetical protein